MDETGHECPYEEADIWEALPKLVGHEKGRAYFELSNAAYSRGNFARSLTLAESARDLFLEMENEEEGLAHSYASVAYSLNSLKKLPDAIEQMSKSVEVFESIGLKDEWTMRRNLANWMQTAKRFEDSGVLFIKCAERELFEGCEVQAALDFFGYAQALCELDKDEDAIKQFRLGRDYFKKHKEVFRVAEADFFIGRCLNHLEDGFEAEVYLRKALITFELGEYVGRQSQALSQLGRALTFQQRYEEALEELNKAHLMIRHNECVNFNWLFIVQKNMIRALKGLGRDNEVLELQRKNDVLDETLELEYK